VNSELGQKFAEWLISVPSQELIASYQINGQQLFTPNSELWNAAQAEATPEAETTPEATPAS
jgi:ABC-type tungstate transport system permease subunit